MHIIAPNRPCTFRISQSPIRKTHSPSKSQSFLFCPHVEYPSSGIDPKGNPLSYPSASIPNWIVLLLMKLIGSVDFFLPLEAYLAFFRAKDCAAWYHWNSSFPPKTHRVWFISGWSEKEAFCTGNLQTIPLLRSAEIHNHQVSHIPFAIMPSFLHVCTHSLSFPDRWFHNLTCIGYAQCRVGVIPSYGGLWWGIWLWGKNDSIPPLTWRSYHIRCWLRNSSVDTLRQRWFPETIWTTWIHPKRWDFRLILSIPTL
jgi:hypothetical protein